MQSGNIFPNRRQNESVDEMLMAGILRVQGSTADIQVFKYTRGVAVGDDVYIYSILCIFHDRVNYGIESMLIME